MSHEVVEVELVLLDLLLQTLGFFFIVLFLSTFYQRYDVTHTENTVGHTRWVELVYCIELFACTHELDRLVHDGTDRKSGTTTSVTIEFSQYHTVEVEAFVELTGCIHSILTGHGVDHEQGFVRIDSLLDGFDFVHHLLINRQTTGCIDDHQVITLSLCFVDSVQCNLNRILAVDFTIYRNTNLFTKHLQLLDRCRTINVASNQQRLAVLLGLEHAGQLTREGSLTRTLETRHQNDSRTAFQLEFGCFATHQLGQLVVYDLDHQLARLYGCQYVLTQCLFLYSICEVLCYFIVHVGIEQCLTYIFQCFSYIDFGDFSFTFQDFKRPFQSFA